MGAESAATFPHSDSPQLERLKKGLADRYAILDAIGQGGMATVYLAEDLRHHRKVAVKVLRPELTASLGTERFLREIEIVAQLHHPHILMLIDSGEADGQLYFVMPFVEGESLRTRLVREGELPVAEVIRVLRDVTDALGYAHDHGVIHRDIKPDNILMSGRHALVSDFGVARAVSQAVTEPSLTTGGLSLGTPAYMAPEQAAADPHIDHRADIYAVGVVAYELLTGAPPFGGDSPQAMMSAHVVEAPKPIDAGRPTIPGQLATIVMRCLEKRPADRWQSAGELLAEFEALATPSGNTAKALAPAVGKGWTRRRTWGTATVVIAIALALLFRRGRTPERMPPAPRAQLTFDGQVSRAEISPDGEFLAYASTINDTTRLLVRDLRGGSTIRVAAIRHVVDLRWAHDGTELFFTGGDSLGRGIRVMFPRLGGAPRPSSCFPFVAPSPDGTQAACWALEPETRIRFVGLTTEDTGSVDPPDKLSDKVGGDWSPDGRFLVLATRTPGPPDRYELWTLRIGQASWQRIVSDSALILSPRWSPRSDAIYFLRGGDLWRISVRSDASAKGQPEAVQIGLDAGSSLSLAGDGSTVVYVRDEGHSSVWVAAEKGHPGSGEFTTMQLTQGTASRSTASWSPDGTRVAYTQWRGEAGDVFVVPVLGGVPYQVTTIGTVESRPAWSSDGKRLVYYARVQGTLRLEVTGSDGGGRHSYAQTTVGDADPLWAPASSILYQPPGNHNLVLFDPESGAERPLAETDSSGQMFSPAISPDGRMVAVLQNGAKLGVWLISLRDSSRRLLRPKWLYPVGWSADGRFMYAKNGVGDSLLIVPLSGAGRDREIAMPWKNADCAPLERSTGLQLVCTVEGRVSDAWKIENFDPEHGRQ